MKNASTITAFIISFLVVGSLALVFLFLDNKEEEPAAAEPAAQTEVPARQTVTPQPTVDPLTKEDISRQTATPPSLINLSSPQTLAQAIAKVIQDRDEDILKSLEIQQAVTENQSRLIRELMEARHIRLSSPGITSIGANNQGANPTARYTLNFSSGARGYLDMKRNDKQQWTLDTLTLPSKQDLAKDKVAPMAMNDPMGIVSSFMDAVAKADFRGARKFVDGTKVQDATVAGLCILFEEGAFRLREDARLSSPGITSIGANNQGANPTARYTLNFSSGARGYLDMKRNDKQQWTLDTLTLPSKQDLAKDKVAPMAMNDPMGIVSSFMDAVAKADFRGARKFVDGTKVQDATVAGLCILFEEGAFRLREDAPIKTAYEAPTNAGFFVHLQDAQGRKAGNVGLTVAKTDGQWLVAEASLDSMLEAYTKRQGAGDDIFIPIVKNPQGGDSLALFFGFNEDTLSKRSERQLQIVAEAIKMDSGKKLEISGHTDDVGSERYNQGLSERRAAAVKAQLVQFGVPAERIVTKGFGKSQPRRTYSPTADEETRDEARKENRRAEMYLDF